MDRNQGKAVITGFHNETSESEVIQLLKESTTEIGMTIENARIECPAKPITHAFIHFKNDDERNKYVRSANMLRKEVRGRKLEVSRSIIGRRGKISSKKNGVRQILHSCETQHPSRSDNYELDFEAHISRSQIVVKTCQSGHLKYIKYQDIETEVERQIEKRQSKKSSQRL